MRGWVQAGAALVQNAYLAFPWTGTLYQGPLKRFCAPGANCHSCPAAVFSCPLGTLQHFAGGVRPALRWGTYRLGFTVVGFLVAVGLLGGRLACGWLCPFGLVQELLHRVPSPKLRVPRALGALRYLVLAVLVLGLPLWAVSSLGYGEAWYCRLLCPSGTMESAGLFFLVPELREQIGWAFAGKLLFLGGVTVWAVLSFRPFCRTLCPLGAIYGTFNRWSLVQVEFDPGKCIGCGACREGCRLDQDPRGRSRSPECLRCFSCASSCPTGALAVRAGGRPAPGGACAPPFIPAS